MEKQKQNKLPLLDQFRHLKEYLVLAGIKAKPSQMILLLVIISAILDIGFLAFLVIKIGAYDNIPFIAIFSIFMFTLGLLVIFVLVWLMFLLMLDYLKFKRRTELEEVLPEFLRLVSANHRAGFSLEISIWKANRPRFGILAEEVNELARNTYASGDLVDPLIKFANKYDSAMLRRVVSNLIEGLKTGADISSLLDDISNNIMTIKNTRKELASEVENYMLFITVTVLVISPLMFGLTHKMSGLIQDVKTQLGGSFGSSTEGGAQSPIDITFNENDRDFREYFDIFVYLMVATNSIMSVLLMSMVKYGNLKQDLKKIPVFYIIGVTVYILCKMMFANFLNI